MKMKKSLLTVAFLLATSSMMAAMSYNQATVESAAELKVVNTNKALLSLETRATWDWENPAGNKDKTSDIKDGQMFIDFGKGLEGNFGLQPNSEYQWNPLFVVRNKSAETIKATISAEGDYAQYITFGLAKNPKSANPLPEWGIQGQPLVLDDIAIGDLDGMRNIRSIAVKINLPSNVVVSETKLLGSIIVNSEALNKHIK